MQQWSNLSLAVKNKAVTDIMNTDNLFVSYLPQDMTAKIDQMIASGKASSLNLHSVSSIVKILTETEAVQSKEFVKWKTTYYASENFPRFLSLSRISYNHDCFMTRNSDMRHY